MIPETLNFLGNARQWLLFAVAVTLPAAVNAASVWTMPGITDSTYGHSWNLNLITSSNTLSGSTVVDLYLDDLSDGQVDPYRLLAASDAGNIRIAFSNGSQEDLATTIQPEFYGGSFDIAATPIDEDSMRIIGVYYSLALYDAAFLSNMNIETYGSRFGYGRLDNDYNAEWSWSGSGVATRTAVSAVPLPPSVWLFGAGILALIVSIKAPLLTPDSRT